MLSIDRGPYFVQEGSQPGQAKLVSGLLSLTASGMGMVTMYEMRIMRSVEGYYECATGVSRWIVLLAGGCKA